MFTFLRRLRARLRYRHFNTELKDELDVHRAMAEDGLRASGEIPEDVQLHASRQLGNVTLARETARGIWIAPWVESIWQDVRYALRGLRASPSFTLPVLGVLIITMGLTTSLFVAAESLLFRPWAVADAKRIVSVSTEQRRGTAVFFSIGAVEYQYLRDHTRSVDLIAMGTMSLRLGPAPDTAPSPVRLVSGNYFSVLRTPLVAGRGIAPVDDTVGGAAVVVISHGLWQREFDGASDAVGSTLLVGGVPFAVIGIADRNATDSPQLDVPTAWISIHARAVLPGMEPAPHALLEAPRGAGLQQIAGRLVEGSSVAAANAEMKSIAAQFATLHDVPPLGISVTSTAFADEPMAKQVVRLFSLLALATGLMLLLGCANVGNLQLARGLSRQSDAAVRIALGASRGRVVRQALIEGLVLAVIAAAVSLLVAQHLSMWLMLRLGAGSAVVSREASLVSLDSSAIVFVFVLAVSVCLLSGLLPALKTTQVSIRTRSGGVTRTRLRSMLLGLQVAISALLLVGTALLVRSAGHAAGAGLGFDPYGIAVVSFALPQSYDAAAREQFSRRVVEAATQSGIGPSAGTAVAPFTPPFVLSNTVKRAGDDERTYRAVLHRVTSGYFDLLSIRVLAGRVFDAESSPEEVVINQALAQLLWPEEPAVGRVFIDNDLEHRVVAVVGDARTENFNQILPAYYQHTGAFTALIVRNDPAAIASAIDIIQRLEPGASPAHRDFVTRLRAQLAPSMAGAAMAATLGALALLLAGVGTLGVFSYLVNERTREIGVRMALGARALDIIRLLTRRMCWPLVGGLAAGVVAALALGRVIASYLHGISPYDPVAYAGVLVVLIAAAIIAAFIPARRAVRVDPAVTLRHE